MSDLSREGWRAFLKQTRPSNTCALFTYLAKHEGVAPYTELLLRRPPAGRRWHAPIYGGWGAYASRGLLRDALL